MNEYDLITKLAARFPRSPRQANALFSSDAEVLDLGGRRWCLTMDEFSPEEDHFSGPPEALGWNLAVATLSDLLACGAQPEFFMQALVLPARGAESFARGFSSGLRKVLAAAGCSLCGGDLGRAKTWRYTGFAMGPAPRSPVGHDLPPGDYSLWVTGRLGDANLAALKGLPTPRFELRLAESRALRAHAAACVDTSGGLADALWLLRRRNPRFRFEIDLPAVPFAPGVERAAAAAGLHAGAFLLGGAGEYELLFALPAGLGPAAASRMQSAGAARIGRARAGRKPGVYFAASGGALAEMKAPPPCPRSAGSVENYIRQTAAVSKRLFGAPA
ncbi:MAG: AIR synthase related protein [Elusimicrobiales bacterium]|nr:AIR synthase related protein [Elusimicrobiales bacterium]